MAELTSFSYDSERAQLARMHRRLHGPLHVVMLIAFAVIFAGGGLLLLAHYSMGWFVMGLAMWPFMLYIWEKRYLCDLPVGQGESIDARIESDILGRLPKELTPKSLAEQLSFVQSAQFLMIRSGISPSMLSQVLASDSDSIPLMWSAARDMQPEGVIRASTIVAALTKTSPVLAKLLPHLQLEEEDLPQLAQWYLRLSELIKRHKKPLRNGGIARDWNFGYLRLLDRFGVNVSSQVGARGGMMVDLEAHRDALDYIIQTFSSGGRQNVSLVGPLGVGKTTVVKALASELLRADADVPSHLKFRQVFSLDASSLISAARGRGELEDLLGQILLEAYRAKNIILCLDDAELFFEEGVGSVDVTNVILPILEGGALRIILTMDEQRWLQIAARNPALANVLNKVTLRPSEANETMLVMQDQLVMLEYQHKVTYMYQAIKEAMRLSDRYYYDQAQPGKALRLLETAAGFAENGLITTKSVQQSIERTQGVKVGAVSDNNEKERLLNLENLIHERMINQKRAVAVVSDALRRARAGVRNEQRPVGTFLFLGPTGTGKTELAKSLAAIYFGGEDRLIRIDLNEFVSADDVSRLIADGADDPMSLSARVMKQPFSVILLDEIEKAHTSVLTALLQVLDEGILRDIKGREVSFRDTIFIATSNAGADQIRYHVEAGEDLEQFEEALQNELIRSGQFRPEFMNRFDEIVLFKPLGKEELYQIIDLILAGINKTLEPQKISVVVDDGAKDILVELGYDPQLGARPLRRAVQRSVESLIAKRMLSGEASPGDTIAITAGDIQK